MLALLILFLDQVLKIYIKTNYYLGEEHIAISGMNWFRLHFIENEGMAYGWKLGGEWGKLALTLVQAGGSDFRHVLYHTYRQA